MVKRSGNTKVQSGKTSERSERTTVVKEVGTRGELGRGGKQRRRISLEHVL